MVESKYLHEILVGNVGRVYEGRSVKDAQAYYDIYRKGMNTGRAQGESVTWMRDGEIYKEYTPKVKRKRVHNEYFRPLSVTRKTCPTCEARLDEGEHVWSWGEYVKVQWRTVLHFCRKCFPAEVLPRLITHERQCGCEFCLNVTPVLGEEAPEWLAMPEKF
jgi:hypothetical protein